MLQIVSNSLFYLPAAPKTSIFQHSSIARKTTGAGNRQP